MARREWTLRLQCAHDCCNETAHFRYPTRRDLESSYEVKWYGYTRGKWRCTRHAKPGEVLSTENSEIEATYTSERRETGVYWGNFGFMQGPGFKAWAEDFPPGTKLIVTARIELPTDAAARPAQGEG